MFSVLRILIFQFVIFRFLGDKFTTCITMDKWLIKVNKNNCDNESDVPCVSSTSKEVEQ